MQVENAVVLHQPVNGGNAVVNWNDAVRFATMAREMRAKIINEALVEGVDYGPAFPGSDKAVLLQPGAQKIGDSFECYPEYVCINKIERWDREDPLFHYDYEVRLRQRGTGNVVSTGQGSANSYESKWYWRHGQRRCPQCGAEAIIKGKAEFGGGFICFSKKGGCGSKFEDNDSEILNQQVGRVRDDDVFTKVNTIKKIAMKRAQVNAACNFGFSDRFTQDVEEWSADEDTLPAHEPPQSRTASKPANANGKRTSKPQQQPQEHKNGNANAGYDAWQTFIKDNNIGMKVYAPIISRHRDGGNMDWVAALDELKAATAVPATTTQLPAESPAETSAPAPETQGTPHQIIASLIAEAKGLGIYDGKGGVKEWFTQRSIALSQVNLIKDEAKLNMIVENLSRFIDEAQAKRKE